MCAHLPKDAKTFDNQVVRVDEFSFAQPINIDPNHSRSVGCKISREGEHSWADSGKGWKTGMSEVTPARWRTASEARAVGMR
jgi:hypothetical protein